ncbi:MAG: hypothetical protein NTY64_02845 [Deltaproteobacteria bacterium]|nr:hypothetical protein [Deltaproteobacteria bacterium]
MINQLAMLTIMVEPGDIMTLGSILEKLEGMEKREGDGEPRSLRELSRVLKELVEKIIVQEGTDPQEGCSLLRSGVGIMQRKMANVKSLIPDPEEEAFWVKMGPLTGVPGGAGEKKEAPVEKKESPEPAKDLEIYRDFVSEGLEHLATIELNIMNLEQDPEDKDCINAIFNFPMPWNPSWMRRATCDFPSPRRSSISSWKRWIS